MDTHYPTIDEPATPEYVLAIFNEFMRQQYCDCWGSYQPDDLAFHSTVKNLAETFVWDECPGWRELGRVCNQVFGIDCSDADWEAVLEPADKKQLAGVCEMIARHARRQVIRPARLLGRTCTSAGAFLTLRSMLQEAGADATEIAPSTLLAPYTRQYVMQFMGPISRLAPGVLPMARIRQPLYDIGLLSYPVGSALAIIGACSFDVFTDLRLLAAAGGLMATGGLTIIAGYALAWIAARWLLPSSVEFGKLRTFRDLALAIAKGGDGGPGIAKGGGSTN